MTIVEELKEMYTEMQSYSHRVDMGNYEMDDAAVEAVDDCYESLLALTGNPTSKKSEFRRKRLGRVVPVKTIHLMEQMDKFAVELQEVVEALPEDIAKDMNKNVLMSPRVAFKKREQVAHVEIVPKVYTPKPPPRNIVASPKRHFVPDQVKYTTVMETCGEKTKVVKRKSVLRLPFRFNRYKRSENPLFGKWKLPMKKCTQYIATFHEKEQAIWNAFLASSFEQHVQRQQKARLLKQERINAAKENHLSLPKCTPCANKFAIVKSAKRTATGYAAIFQQKKQPFAKTKQEEYATQLSYTWKKESNQISHDMDKPRLRLSIYIQGNRSKLLFTIAGSWQDLRKDILRKFKIDTFAHLLKETSRVNKNGSYIKFESLLSMKQLCCGDRLCVIVQNAPETSTQPERSAASKAIWKVLRYPRKQLQKAKHISSATYDSNGHSVYHNPIPF